MTPLLDSALIPFNALWSITPEHPLFWIMPATAFLAGTLTVRMMMGLCHAKRGIIQAFGALLFPTALTLLVFALIYQYGAPLIDNNALKNLTLYAIPGLVLILSLMTFGRRLMGFGRIGTVFIFSLGMGLGLFASVISEYIIESMSSSADAIEEREQRIRSQN
jgi:hypothetical protein